MAERIRVEIFGITGQAVTHSCQCGGNCGCGGGGCGCGGHDEDDITMDEMYVDFLKYVNESDLKDQIEAEFIDVYTDAIKDNMDVVYAIKGGYQLPITAINGKLLFQGGIDSELIVDYIKATILSE